VAVCNRLSWLLVFLAHITYFFVAFFMCVVYVSCVVVGNGHIFQLILIILLSFLMQRFLLFEIVESEVLDFS